MYSVVLLLSLLHMSHIITLYQVTHAWRVCLERGGTSVKRPDFYWIFFLLPVLERIYADIDTSTIFRVVYFDHILYAVAHLLMNATEKKLKAAIAFLATWLLKAYLTGELTGVSILEPFLVANLWDLLGVLLAGVIQTPGETASTCSTEASIAGLGRSTLVLVYLSTLKQ